MDSNNKEEENVILPITNYKIIMGSGLLIGKGKLDMLRLFYAYGMVIGAFAHYAIRIILDYDNLLYQELMECIHWGSVFFLVIIILPWFSFYTNDHDELEKILISGFYTYDGNYAKERRERMIIVNKRIKTFTNMFIVLIPIGFSSSYFKGIFTGAKITKYQVPYPGWFPFAVDSPLSYTAALMYHLFMGLNFTFISIGFVTTFNTFVAHLCNQIEILHFTLSKCLDVDVNDKEREKIIMENIKRCVKQHQKCYEFFSYIQHFFWWPLLATCVIIALMLCTLGFQITDPTVSPSSVAATIAIIFPETAFVFVFCWLAQQLTDLAEATDKVIQDLNWYEQTSNVQKMLLIILIRNSKPLVITGGGLQTLSMEGFSQMLQASYSAFNMLGILRNK